MDTFQRYVASPVILSAAQFFFDKMVYSFTYQQAFYDSILTLGSLLGSKIVTNIFVAKTVGVLDNYYASNFISYLAEPLLNYIAYNYLYKEQFQKNYISKEKGDLALMLMPIFQSIAGMFLDKTITQKNGRINQEHVYEDEEDFKNYLYYEYYYQLIENIQLPAYLFDDVYLAIIEKQMILVKDVIYFFEGEAQEKYNFIYENMKNFKQVLITNCHFILKKIWKDIVRLFKVITSTQKY
ncbi:hypothetical protein ABPG72_020093 [Tetrahymena utriculariae]